jgi:hypothetical protein
MSVTEGRINMSLAVFFRTLSNKVRFATWTEEEQLALLRIVDDLYRADGHYSVEELDDFRKKLSLSAVCEEDLEQVPTDKAMRILKEDPSKLELAYTILAEAVYSDGRFVREEREYLDQLITRYQLDGAQLETRLKRELRKSSNEDLTQ